MSAIARWLNIAIGAPPASKPQHILRTVMDANAGRVDHPDTSLAELAGNPS